MKNATVWDGLHNTEGLIKMNLQAFAADEPAEPGQEEEEKRTYTQEELDEKLQSVTDKRVTEAIKTARAKWEEEYSARLEKEKDEAAKMAKMTEAQRKEAEIEKERKAFDAEREQFQREKLELEVVKQLSEEGLSTKFSAFLMGMDAETSIANIQTFKSAFDEEVEKRVKERLSGHPPKANNATQAHQGGFMNIADYANERRLVK